MFALSGLALAALGVLAALIVYGLAWRATSGRSMARSGPGARRPVAAHRAYRVAGMLLLSPAMRRSAEHSEPQLSSPLQDELLREAERDVRGQTRMRDQARPQPTRSAISAKPTRRRAAAACLAERPGTPLRRSRRKPRRP